VPEGPPADEKFAVFGGMTPLVEVVVVHVGIGNGGLGYVLGDVGGDLFGGVDCSNVDDVRVSGAVMPKLGYEGMGDVPAGDDAV
jgi:hypothetical protein